MTYNNKHKIGIAFDRHADKTGLDNSGIYDFHKDNCIAISLYTCCRAQTNGMVISLYMGYSTSNISVNFASDLNQRSTSSKVMVTNLADDGFLMIFFSLLTIFCTFCTDATLDRKLLASVTSWPYWKLHRRNWSNHGKPIFLWDAQSSCLDMFLNSYTWLTGLDL